MPPPAAVAAALAATAIAVLALAGAGGSRPPSAVPFDGRSPRGPEGAEVRVLFGLPRPSLGERAARDRIDPAGERAYVRSLRRESQALRSALAAKAVRLRDVVSYERVWNGFAATIATEDIPQVQTLGVRVQEVRRFYPATEGAAPARAPARRSAPGTLPAGPPADVALLDTGVDLAHPALRGRVVPGYDALDRDRDPSPASSAGARDEHGTQIAGVLLRELGAGGRIRAIRVAGLQPSPATGALEEAGTTDKLLTGLERAVDPDGNGDTRDAAAVALVGVSSPYSGFADAPEAEAVAAAAGLGMLVVAPAGNEGARIGRFGTIGSPAAAPAALAVGALEGGAGEPALPSIRLGLAGARGRATLDGHLLGGDAGALRARAVGLSGPSQADPSGRARAAGGRLLDYFSVDGRPRARGRLVVVPASAAGGPPAPLADVAVAARAAGAAGLVVCDPGNARLAAIPRAAAGPMPVIGLSGSAARRALELTREGSAEAFVGGAERRESVGEAKRAPASSDGPTYALYRKPDLFAGGTASAPLAGGGEALAAGTSVAAARVAAVAARLARARPSWTPRELAAALVGTAGRAQGEPDPRRAAAAPVLAVPGALSLPRRPAGRAFAARSRIVLRNPGAASRSVTLSGELPGGVRVQAAPARVRIAPGRARSVTVTVRAPAGVGAGYLEGTLAASTGGRSVRIPLALPVGPPPPAPLGPLALLRENGRVRGVRFAAGSVRRAGDARAVLPLGELTLRLVTAGGEEVRELTPPGGATDLLPGEYAYTLTGPTLRELPAGTYRFLARARGPGRGAGRAARRSRAFEIR